MAKLSDFATLAEAQAYTETTLKPISERMINERGIFALLGMVSGESLLTAIEATPSIPARVKNWFKPSEQGVDITDPSVQTILSGMVAGGVISEAEKDVLVNHGYDVKTPFIDVDQVEFDFNKPEELVLPSNTAQHIINFNITNSATSLVTVTAMHRYGAANDLTPWHSCGATRGQYKQSPYRIMVPAVEAEVRELKLVTDYQLGLTS